MKNIAIVTGVLGGIGAASARLLIQRGYTVVGMSRRPPLPDADPRLICVQGDVSLAADRKKLLQTAAAHGRIAVLVNVAGVAPLVRTDILDMTEESYDRVMGINTKGALFLTQAVANHMLTQAPENGVRGYIVNISSCSAYTSSPSRGEYCISKAGVSMMTRLFADRLAGEGIPVNEICPGIIDTEMTAAVKDKYDRLIAEGLVPQGRWGTPEDVAKAVLTLCDGTLGYTTGTSLIVDGGMHIRRL